MIALGRFLASHKQMVKSENTSTHFKVVCITVRYILLGIYIFSPFNLLSQAVFIDENMAYTYKMDNEVRAEHHVFQYGDSVIFHVELSFNDRFFDDFQYVFRLMDSYHTADVLMLDSIEIQKHIFSIRAGKVFIRYSVLQNPRADLAIFRIIDKKSGIDYNFDIPLITDYNFSNDGLIFYEADGSTPFLSNFIGSGQEFVIGSTQPFDNPIFGFHYSYNFEEAQPPMNIEEKKGNPGFAADSVFTVRPGEVIKFAKTGLYFFQKDSSSTKGIGLRIQDKYFPVVKTFNEILPPLIYISTSSETNLIRNAANPKQAFDQFWIENVKIPSLASETVARFYDRVAGANYLFTSFKEGWKTDMGLIYIIFGPPNDAYKSEELIEWVYNQDMTMPNLRFSFYKVKNIFTDNHYSLMRKKTYDKVWFKTVEMWRTGKIK